MQANQLKKELSNITLNTERPLTAANSYSNIADGVNAAKELVDLSNQAANNATELVSSLVFNLNFEAKAKRKLLHIFRVRALTYAPVSQTKIHAIFWEMQEKHSTSYKQTYSRTETMHPKPLNKSKS